MTAEEIKKLMDNGVITQVDSPEELAKLSTEELKAKYITVVDETLVNGLIENLEDEPTENPEVDPVVDPKDEPVVDPEDEPVVDPEDEPVVDEGDEE